MQNTPILQMKGISKSFPGVKALSSIDLDLYPGEVHVLAGENGAGKSTIMKVMSGVYRPDEGQIFIDGQKVDHLNPQLAAKYGIRMIYQELNLIPELSVASNIFLGHEKFKALGVLDRKKMEQEAREIFRSMDVDIDPSVKVKELGVGKQQIVEIAKALSMDSRIIVFDEPTSSLMDKEINELFALIRRLKAENIGMFYISHRLEELFEIGDRVSILRDGQLIDCKPIKDLTMEELIYKIANRELNNLYPHVPRVQDEVILEVKGLSNEKCKQVDLQIHKGEIVGLAGLVGAGRTELARAIFGVDDYFEGSILLDGKKLPKHNPGKSVTMGLGLLPEERKTEGLALKLSIKENTTIAALGKLFSKGIIKSRVELEETRRFISDLKIAAPSPEKRTAKLSGGTQQKVVVAKWLLTDAKVLIFDEPTRGIDVGAKTSIYEIIDELASQGVGILMISSDLQEVLGMSDRVYVMADGKIVAEKKTKETNQTEVLSFAFNAT